MPRYDRFVLSGIQIAIGGIKMSSIHDGKTRPGRKARILLLFSIVTCVSAISAAFHNCYVVDGYHPGLPPNVYPSIDSLKLNPSMYAITNIDLSQYCENDMLMQFSISEIYDPDKESKMYGKFYINYNSSLQISVDLTFHIFHSMVENENTGIEEESDVLWEASFPLSAGDFYPAGSYVMLAAVSDREWTTAETGGYFDVPEDTQPAFVTWYIVTTGTLKTEGCPGV
jgi:hypothetical protein